MALCRFIRSNEILTEDDCAESNNKDKDDNSNGKEENDDNSNGKDDNGNGKDDSKEEDVTPRYPLAPPPSIAHDIHLNTRLSTRLNPRLESPETYSGKRLSPHPNYGAFVGEGGRQWGFYGHQITLKTMVRLTLGITKTETSGQNIVQLQ